MDEYKSRDTYRKIIAKFGPVRPFINIVEAEQRHIELLRPLYEKYAIPLPAEPDPNLLSIPETLESACQMGVTGELENVAMYDRLVAATDLPDVVAVLKQLQAASRDHHLPAFQRCAGQGSGPQGGRGFGRGNGGGSGRGRGRGRGFGQGSRSNRFGLKAPILLSEKYQTLDCQRFLRQTQDYLLNDTGAFA